MSRASSIPEAEKEVGSEDSSEVEKEGIEGTDLVAAGFLVLEGAALGFEGREASSSARSRAASALRATDHEGRNTLGSARVQWGFQQAVN